jgi:hypothetical protein
MWNKGGVGIMAMSIFIDKARQPTEIELNQALMETRPLLEELKDHLAALVGGPVSSEWIYYSQKSGWILLLKHLERVLLFLCPRQDYFLVQYTFGEKSFEAARCECLPAVVSQAMENAWPDEHGRAFQVQIHTPEDLDCVKNLAAIKLSE